MGRIRVLLLLLFVATFAVAQVPLSDHVVLMVLENHSYEQVIGNPNMPYLNSLATQNGVATQYFANSHYSIPNYFWLTTGQYVTLNDATTRTFNVDNVVRRLLTAGKTWKAYEEDLPSVGYIGGDIGNYEKRHDPFAYLTDVINSSEVNNIVPYTQLATDLANNALPNYSFITPNGLDDGHNANLAYVDRWLKSNLPTLLGSAPFQPGGDGVLFITFDESLTTDCRPLATCPPLPENGGGGRVATLVIGPKVAPGYQSTTTYQHPSTLRTMLLALGVTTAPGAAANAAAMTEFFVGSAPPPPPPVTPQVVINTPVANAILTDAFGVDASFNAGTASYMKLWVDGVATFKILNTSTLHTTLSLLAGKHHLTVQAYWNSTIYSASEYVTVQ